MLRLPAGLVLFLALVQSALAQQGEITVTGKVTAGDTGRDVIPGVTVLAKGTTKGTITDGEGNFSLAVPQNAVLVFSSIGYLAREVPVEGQSKLLVQLPVDTRQLDEVIVVGYGTQEKKNLIGAVTKVNPAETRGIAVGSVDAQLQGKVAGVQISSPTGVPGETSNIRVRGATSINASNDPLYVVDGVFINGNSLQTINTGGKSTSPLADINPADIESIEVLKDAEATALYGSRGANGVVIITTRRGNYNQKPQVSFNTSHGFSEAVKLWDLATGPQHAELVNEWWVNTGLDNQALKRTYENRPYRPASEGGRGLPEEQPTYDRLSEVFRRARVHNYDLSLAGGTASTKFYVGGSYTTQESIIRPIAFNRASFKVNLDQKVNDRIQVGVSNTFSRTYRNQARAGDGPRGGLLQAALHTPTNASPYNDQGEPVSRAGFDNVTSLIEHYDVNSVSLRYIGNLFAEAELLPNLKFRTSFGLDYNNYNESEYWNTFLIEGSQGGLGTSSVTQYSTWLNEQTLSYRKTVANAHTFGVLVGNTLQSDVLTRTYAEGRGFPNNDFRVISSAATTSSAQGWSKSTLASFFSRVDYNFRGKYLVDFSIRADGSSRFGAANQWGYFPAVGAAWRIKEENFLKDAHVVSDLKLRASYGITGNQNLTGNQSGAGNQSGIGNFAAQGLWSGFSYGGSPGIGPQQLGNPDLKWERTRQVNVGLNLGLFGNRVALEANVYDKYTTDGLLQIPLGPTTGFSSYWSNAAEISNRGFELGLRTENIRKGNFTWTTDLNVARNVNKIEKLANPLRYGSRDLILLQEGHPLYSFWVYKQLYVDSETGNAVYDDVNGDGKTTVADRQIYGSIWPKYFGGLTNTLTWGGFDLNVFLAFQYGNKVYNHNAFFGEAGGARDEARVIFARNLDRWQQPGDVTDVPRIDGINIHNYRDGGSRWLEDGSFVRLRSLNLGYSLPKGFTDRLRLQALRVYVSGTNLLLLTRYTGADPESSASASPNAQGIDLGTPPQPRTVQLGLNVTL